MTQIKEGDKLYVITRSDLSPGYRIAQSCHAAIQFVIEHNSVSSDWITISNYIAVLELPGESDLKHLIKKAYENKIPTSIFMEPDLSNEITAIALCPGEASKKLCSNIPLALKKMF